MEARAVTMSMSDPRTVDGFYDDEVAGGKVTELLPTIELRQDLAAVTDEALAALAKNSASGVFCRAGLPVRVVRDNARRVRGLRRFAGAPVIERVPLPWLRDRIARSARWVRWVKDDCKAALVPAWVADNIATRDELPFPTLEGVVEAPTMRTDGSVLETPGYDEQSALLYEPSIRFAPVPTAPTANDVRAAVAVLLEVVSEFPFVAACDRAAAIAAILTAVARSAIDGPAPLFAFRATAPGSGKTLLADLVATIATGRGAARMVLGKADEEVRKLILAIGLEGAAVPLFDNAEGTIGSSTLAAAITSTTFADRLLGVTKRITVSLRGTTWLMTGNNVTFRADLGRRVLPVDLDAGVEHPEDRDCFAILDLVSHARMHRAKLVVAALTLLRGYHDARLPPHGLPRMGSFEAWDDLIRGACIWAELGDPAAARQRIREEGDSDLEALRAAHAAWHTKYGVAPVTVPEVVADCARDHTLRDGLSTLGSRRSSEQVDGRVLGYSLRRFRGRLADGLRFEYVGKTHGRVRWRVAGPGCDGGEGCDVPGPSPVGPFDTDGRP